MILNIMLNSQHKKLTPLKSKNLNPNLSQGSLTPKYQSTFNHSQKYTTSGNFGEKPKTNINSNNFSQIKSTSVCKCKQPHACNHMSCKSGGGVSYAQLQIILENLQKIKEKANNDLKIYQTTIKQQEVTIKELEMKLNRYQNIQETIKTERQLIKNQFRAELVGKSQQIDIYKSSISKLEEEHRNLTRQNIELNQHSSLLQEKMNNASTQLQYFKQRYEKITKQLKISNQEEFISQIKQKFGSISLMFEHITKIQIKLQQQTESLQKFRTNEAELDSRVQQSLNLQQHLIAQIESLKQKNENLHGLSSQQKSEIEQYLNNIQNLQHQNKATQNSYIAKLATNQQILAQRTNKYELIIRNLQSQIRALQEQIKKTVDIEQGNKNQEIFKAIVEEICDESQDYENIIRRMQYLEKFRNQYYAMNNKIQFLCRMLDE